MQLFIEQELLETFFFIYFGAAFDRDIEMKVRILHAFMPSSPPAYICLKYKREIDSIICEI